MHKVAGLRKWRREMVLMLTCEGKTNPYISDKLKVPLRSVERDIQYWDNCLSNNGLLDKRILWECEKGAMTYDTVVSYMSDIMKDISIDPKARVGAANAITNAIDKKLNLIRGKDTLKRTVKLITTLKQRTDLSQGLTDQNSKQTIVTEEETRITSGSSNN